MMSEASQDQKRSIFKLPEDRSSLRSSKRHKNKCFTRSLETLSKKISNMVQSTSTFALIKDKRIRHRASESLLQRSEYAKFDPTVHFPTSCLRWKTQTRHI